MQITHLFESLVADHANANPVRPSNWNALHVILAHTSTPTGIVERQVWVEVTGTIGVDRVAALKIRDGGVDRTIASITY